MSEHLHPDIDSLNAFVEGALQEQERLQCLTHLSECPRCREIVFHAQESPFVGVAPMPTRRWRRWFAPIPVLAAAAIVCIALGGTWLYLRSRMEAPPREVVATRVKQPPQSPENRVEPQVSKPSIAREEKHSVRARSYAPPPVAKDARSEIARAATPPTMQPPPEIRVPAVAQPPLPFSTPQAQPPPAIVEARSSEGGSGISGTVTDPSGAVVPGASVQLRQLAGKMTSNARTDMKGEFKFSGLPAGKYEVIIQSPGFRSTEQQIEVQSQEIAEVRPVLEVGAAAETVTVEAASPTLQTESSEIARKSTRKQSLPPPEPRPLPSGLPAATMVTRGKVMLALDSAGALFFSGNTGKSWKAVKPPWSGKVVDLASPAEPPQPSTVGFQLTTDSDSIWLSKDGRHWYPAPSRH
jgi:hypothetical protein